MEKNQSNSGGRTELALKRIQMAVLRESARSVLRSDAIDCVNAIAFFMDQGRLEYWCTGLDVDPEWLKGQAMQTLHDRFGSDEEVYAAVQEMAAVSIQRASRSPVKQLFARQAHLIYLKMKIAKRKNRTMEEAFYGCK